MDYKLSEYKQRDFIWWVGQVVDNLDPKMLGRLKINIFGFYDNVEKEKLPWVIPMGDIYSSGMTYVGRSPTGLEIGSNVFGFMFDGEDAQTPVYIGTFYGEKDIHPNAQEKPIFNDKSPYIGSYPDKKRFIEPRNGRLIKYPQNFVQHTRGGHSFETNDTEKNKSIHYRHPSGTDIEITDAGQVVIHSVSEIWLMSNAEIFAHSNSNINVSTAANLNATVGGNLVASVAGSADYNIAGNYNLNIGGNMTVNVKGNTTHTSQGNHKIVAARIDLN